MSVWTIDRSHLYSQPPSGSSPEILLLSKSFKEPALKGACKVKELSVFGWIQGKSCNNIKVDSELILLPYVLWMVIYLAGWSTAFAKISEFIIDTSWGKIDIYNLRRRGCFFPIEYDVKNICDKSPDSARMHWHETDGIMSICHNML